MAGSACREPALTGLIELMSNESPLAPEDYYFEDALLVFTAAYHLKRGYCCGSGCRHCPYDHVNVPRDQRPESDAGPIR